MGALFRTTWQFKLQPCPFPLLFERLQSPFSKQGLGLVKLKHLFLIHAGLVVNNELTAVLLQTLGLISHSNLGDLRNIVFVCDFVENDESN